MFKTGIYKLSQINKRKNFFGGTRKISITLYNQLNNSNNNTNICENILSLFSNEKGAYKKTFFKRFKLIENEVSFTINNHFPLKDKLIIHDTAISDGRTSVDFYKMLKKIRKNIVFYSSDYEIYYLTFVYGFLKLTLSKNYKLLEILMPPFVFNIIKYDNRYLYPFNFMISSLLKIYYKLFIYNKIITNKIKSTKIELVNFEIDELKKNNDFNLMEYNLLNKFVYKCHIIRSFNVFVPSYFNINEINNILKNIFLSLNENGLFIVGYNNGPESNFNGNIFVKKSSKFLNIKKFGEGSHFLNQINDFNFIL